MRPLLVVLLLLSSVVAASAQELVYRGEQTLWQDTVWSGEVLIDGVLTVAPQVTLEIRPGTTVRFTRFDSNGDGIGEHELFAQGVLLAKGTAAQPIRFTSAQPQPRPGDWGALNLMASEDPVSRLDHVEVEYGYRGFHAHFSAAQLVNSDFRHNLRGVQFQESTVTLDGCRIEENLNGIQFRDSKVTIDATRIAGNYWGLRCVYSEVLVHDSEILDNLVNGLNLRDSKVMLNGNRVRGNRRGIYLQRSTGEAVGNRVEANSEHGLFLEACSAEVHDNVVRYNGRAGVKWLDSRGLLRNNDLSENGMYALYNEGTSDLDARYNWWGPLEGQQLAQRIFAAHQRAGLGAVDWSEPLSQVPRPVEGE